MASVFAYIHIRVFYVRVSLHVFIQRSADLVRASLLVGPASSFFSYHICVRGIC